MVCRFATPLTEPTKLTKPMVLYCTVCLCSCIPIAHGRCDSCTCTNTSNSIKMSEYQRIYGTNWLFYLFRNFRSFLLSAHFQHTARGCSWCIAGGSQKSVLSLMRARRPCRRQFYLRFCLWFYSLLFICETQPHSLRFHFHYIYWQERKNIFRFPSRVALMLRFRSRHPATTCISLGWKKITPTHSTERRNECHYGIYGRCYKYEWHGDIRHFDCHCYCIDGNGVRFGRRTRHSIRQ